MMNMMYKCGICYFSLACVCCFGVSEFDSIALSRSHSCSADSAQSSRRLLAELLMQLSEERFASRSTSTSTSTHSNSSDSSDSAVVVVAATNRVQDLDEAILRRFDAKVLVDVPDQKSRTMMIHRLMKGVDHELSVADVESIAERIAGWSGAEIEVCACVCACVFD